MATAHTHLYTFISSGIRLRYLVAAVICSTLLWVLFRFFYPNPNIIFDSYHYINAAVEGDVVNAWPIGYSWFIRLVGAFTHSAYTLLTIQYILLQTALLFFFFTFCYFLRPAKYTTLLLFMLIQCNPIFLYTANLILSDTLFTAMSLLWASQLIWLLHRPRWYMVLTHALLLLITFTIRYNALYYPFVATVVFMLSPQQKWFKIAGITLQAVFLGGFILFTTHQMQLRYGTKQFSAFGGWKLASDALYMYEHVYQQPAEAMPAAYLALDRQVKAYFNRPHQAVNMLYNDPTWGSYYMYMYPSPLITYMHSQYGADYYPADFKNFSRMGPLYQNYGAHLVKTYPFAFFQHFILPNVQRYFAPPQEVYVDSTNPFRIRKDLLSYRAIQWFGIKSLKAPSAQKAFRTNLFNWYPGLTAATHILFILTGILFLIWGNRQLLSKSEQHTLLFIAVLWCYDFGFNVLAAGVVMRYQLFILLIETAFCIYLIQHLLTTPLKKTNQ